jgi:SET domain-containing protein
MMKTPLVEVRSSNLEGQGVFAIVPIAGGTVVLPLTGKPITRAEMDKIGYNHVIHLQIDENLFLEAHDGPDDFFNHSCVPNTAFTEDGRAFRTLRDIAVGEELLFDYCTAEETVEQKVTCLCGEPQCRGLIGGFADLSPEDQQRLYPFCLPYLKRKYENILRKTG